MTSILKRSNSHAMLLGTTAAALSLWLINKAYSSTKKKSESKTLEVEVNAESAVRKIGQTSHITIPTNNIKATKEFFEAFGLKTCPNNSLDDNSFEILTCPNPEMHQPYIVLEKIDSNESLLAGCASGIGRLCIGVKDVYETMEQLKNELDMEPIAPPICDRPGTPDEKGNEMEVIIVAYRDKSSGIMLEIVSLQWPFTSLEFPIFVHANINVSNYDNGLEAYKTIGYTEIYNLYKSLQEVTILKTKTEMPFCIDLIEKKLHESNDPSFRLGFTVKDLPNELDRITRTNLWALVDNPKIVRYSSPLDTAIVATIRNNDGMKVDLVEYPVSINNLENPLTTKDKIVVVTGCDSGFGRSLACRLTLLGFNVIAACYTEKGAKFLNDLVMKTVVADLGTSEGITSLTTTCREELKNKSLWAIVNNAGVCMPGNVDWLHPNTYKKSMDVNFHAPVAIIYELLQELKSVPGSRIMQTSSVCGIVATPTNSAYASTKHALEAYSDSLRCELHPYDCYVTIVQPATMKTPLALSYFDAWYDGFQQASECRQQDFNKDKIEDWVSLNKKGLYDMAQDSDVTTLAMVKALIEPNPPTRLQCGASVESFYKPLSEMSDKLRDSLLWDIFQFDLVHAKTSKK